MWDWAAWGSLAVAICSGIAGVALVLTRVRTAWRSVKRAHSRAVANLDALTSKLELTEGKAESAVDTRELRESVARLRGSLAQLAVLRAALAEVEAQLGWIRVLL